MKKLLLLICLLLTGVNYGQSTEPLPANITTEVIYDKIYHKLEVELSKYCKSTNEIKAEEETKKKENRELTDAEREKFKPIHSKVQAVNSESLLKQSKIIFNTVITGNKDAVNNGSAFSYSQDKDKHKFSANMAFAGKKWDYSLIDVGTNISSTDNNYKYYSKGKWANDVGVKVGYNIRLKTSQFFMDTTCSRISQLREIAIRERLAKIKEAINLKRTSKQLRDSIKLKNKEQYESLKIKNKTVANYKTEAENLNKQLLLIEEIEEIMDVKDKKEDREYRQFLKSLDKQKISGDLKTTIERDTIILRQINKYVDHLLSEFDDKNNPFHGYSIIWLNGNTNVTNSALSIKGDTLMVENLQKIYTGRMKSNLEISGNLSWVGIKTIQYGKIYTSLNQISFLDSPNLIDVPLRIIPDQPDNISYYNVVDDENNIIDRYDEIRTWKYSLDIGGIYSNLFLFDKTLGLILRANINVPAFHNIGMFYDQNYTLLAGPVFRVASNSVWSSATFTINTGVENQLVSDGDWGNRFVVKASVGIPFTIFEKSKPATK